MKAKNCLLVLITLIATISSCKKENTGACTRNDDEAIGKFDKLSLSCSTIVIPTTVTGITGGTFKIDTFIARLRSNLTSVTGYQTAVAYQGKIIATATGGSARLNSDCVLYMNDCNQMNIASQTKTITMVAVMQLLNQLGLSLDDSIGPFLPSSWVVPAYFRAMPFRNLLLHTSGINSINQNFDSTISYAGLRSAIASGPLPTEVPSLNSYSGNTRNYKNANYALFRVIIPSMWGQLATSPAELQNSKSNITDALSSKYYEMYVKQFVLTPSGVTDATLDAGTLGDKATLFYNFGIEAKGTDMDKTWANITGGGGWVMRATDLALFENVWNENSNVLDVSSRTLVYNTSATQSGTTWYPGLVSNGNSTRGPVYGHGGDLNGGTGQMHGITLVMPDKIYICVQVNSDLPLSGNSNNLANWVINAYDASW